ncbi:hypothetical protein E3N88_44417 [Mikania micrantha]|uniref:Reverse transcriptase RNase H-like domain-containing protein n=1 Tax=Mikania micrantha TaxID=192012 RepID=A0A5N6LC44_9ASTR|nr:hypothetical protein E3N88_44417 [Mikania micrantha]
MRQRRWVELLNDYECSIKYHPGKTNVVADALNRKDTSTRRESLRDMEKQLDVMSNGTRCFTDRLWIPLHGGLRELVMDEAHKSRYSVHPESDKMYHDLRALH